jgi:hypothetical protein
MNLCLLRACFVLLFGCLVFVISELCFIALGRMGGWKDFLGLSNLMRIGLFLVRSICRLLWMSLFVGTILFGLIGIWGVGLLGRRGVELSLMSGHPRCVGSLAVGMGCCEGIGWVTGSFCFLGMGRIASVRIDCGLLFGKMLFLVRFCC